MASREQKIFTAALELPETQRAAFLDETCAGDCVLRARIATLLHASDSAGPFLADDDEPGERSGTVIGAYRLEAPLGDGGFGTVWRARQESPVRRTVALKIIKLGMDTRAVVARFAAERQALALMDHPHIARVFDAGATATGRPYFVMELVEGVPITRFCREQRLTLRARLGLFLQVCEAVHHAHQKGIIHRDLKPSNILASPGSSSPAVKVIDFGVAKATREPLTDLTLITRRQLFLGTPAYMSPEQLGHGEGGVDTRADIYSLGALLYELLADATPFDLREATGSLGIAAIERIVCEREPEPPSRRLAALAADAAREAAVARQTTPARLVADTRGDLDQIVLKCLEKEPARRYATTEALARDVERFLRDEPVQARPATWSYRAKKFARRHRGPVLGVTLAAATLAALSLHYTYRLTEARDQAQRAAKRAEAVSALLTMQLSSSDPYRVLGLREQAEIRASVRRDFADDPAMRLEILASVGRTLLRRGQRAPAQAVLEEAIEAARAVNRPLPYFGQALNDLGVIHRERGDFVRAQGFLERAVDVRRNLFAEVGANDLAVSLVELGRNHLALEQVESAETLFRQALMLRREALGPEHGEVATSLGDLAEVEWLLGRVERAERYCREVAAMFVRTLGPEHPNVASSKIAHARVRLDLGDAAGAETLTREGLALLTRTLGPRHWRTGRALSQLATIWRHEGRLVEAEQQFREALAIVSEDSADNPVQIAAIESELARVLLLRGGNAAAAESLLRTALERQQRFYPAEGWHIAATKSLLGEALVQQRRFAEAEPLLLAAHAILPETAGPRGWETAPTRERLARLYREWDKPELAARYATATR